MIPHKGRSHDRIKRRHSRDPAPPVGMERVPGSETDRSVTLGVEKIV